jgi:phosphoribosyl-ATP pyrophosphohydrolase/phosphoribosyl-AMP cyclohydrolase
MIQLDEKGLVPAIAQDNKTNEVLMLGYMNPGALKRTIECGQMWFYSRSKSNMWHKGEISGNYLKVVSAALDCDGDAIVFKVEPEGPVCHTGERSCFFTPIDKQPEFKQFEKGSRVLEELFATIQDRKLTSPEGSYTAVLFKEGVERIAQKVIEEAGEAAIASVIGKQEQLVKEVADLVYHSLVLLSASDLTPEDVWQVLRNRQKTDHSNIKCEPF